MRVCSTVLCFVSKVFEEYVLQRQEVGNWDFALIRTVTFDHDVAFIIFFEPFCYQPRRWHTNVLELAATKSLLLLSEC